jgi:hypothetical protein
MRLVRFLWLLIIVMGLLGVIVVSCQTPSPPARANGVPARRT